MSFYFAVKANPALANSVEEFLQAVSHGRPNIAEKYIAMVDHMTETMMAIFMLEPAEAMNLRGTQRKIVDFAVSTGSKASHALTRQAFKKQKTAVFERIAKRFSDWYVTSDQSSTGQPCLAVTIDQELAKRFVEAETLVHDGKGAENRATIIPTLSELADAIIDGMFKVNADEAEVGFVIKKALEVGIDGSRKAIHAVNNKLVADLNSEQMIAFLSCYDNVVRENP